MKDLKLEKNNYSCYEPDAVIEIDKYISESKGFLTSPLMRALQGEKALLIAPTGSGKTYSMIDMLKEFDKVGDIKSIFIVPNSVNVEQIKVEYNIPGSWGDIPVLPELEKGNVVVMTWDKFIQLDEEILKDYIVVLDEVHQTYIDMFRITKINKLYENLNYCKGQIDITATPNKLDFNSYSYILEYKQKVQTKYNVKLYNGIDDNVVINIIKKSKKTAMLKDDTNYLNFIKEVVSGKKIDVVTSNTRNFSETYKEIVTKSTMKNVDVICNTSVLVAGINIYDDSITDIIIIGEKDIATIKQYVARFRGLEEVNVHIFNNYGEDESKIYEIEWLVNVRSEEVGIDIDYYNKKNHTEKFVEQVLELSPIRLNSSNEYYWSNDEYKYIVNEVGIRNTCYTRYYTKADIDSFKVLLEEYFLNTEMVDIQDANNSASKTYNMVASEEKKEILGDLAENKDILVGAVEVLTNRASNKLEKYFAEVGTTTDDIKDILEAKGINEQFMVGGIAKTINLYTKYVIENGYNYELAWCIANKGNRSRGKFFGQLNNIIYREIQEKYPELMRYVRIEDKVYNYIVNIFRPGKAYTNEHLEMFCEAIEMTIPGVKLTTKALSELLAQIYCIESKQYKKGSLVPPVDFIYNKLSNPTGGTFDKKKRISTIKSFLTLEDVIKQNKLDDLSLKVMKNLLSERIKQIEEEAVDINSMSELFIS